MTQPPNRRLITEATVEGKVATKVGTGGALDAALGEAFVPVGSAAPLARAGQTPAQEPVAASGTVGHVGVLGIAARADHIHPAPPGMGFGTFLGTPAGSYPSIVLDGTDQTQDWYSRLSLVDLALSHWLGRAGSVYYPQFLGGGQFGGAAPFHCGDLTIDAGVTLEGYYWGGGISRAGMPVVIVSNGTVTINGTIDTRGESPAAGAAPAQAGGAGTPTPNDLWYGGYAGAVGGTGAGAAAPAGADPTWWGLGGCGGAGGASGGNAGGAGGGQYHVANSAWNPEAGPVGLMFLMNPSVEYPQENTSPRGATGGLGGAAGAGDGANKGGSGGGGGGNIVIIAKRIVIGATGILNASGGNGAPGAGGNAAGGGGGGTGIINLHATEIDIDPAAQLITLPGNGGAGVGTGAAGSAGPTFTGLVPVVGDPPPPFGRGYGAGKIIMAWA
ncbi:hypothetical protein Back2_17970 [Nocardioides baekrokdamisoli]|uniref:Uncharacterized protein n=1 Tax=Nocardioides baekrokdamisoli TaxID=1804624 RepID=A0A3G9IEU0_9ACTN|nr:hypothetical protein [Nocardioides baekrokdamisoli]BBH17510.1 hypothetical protein Back2_17970 [Nocardioides baekrokdamisoli]